MAVTNTAPDLIRNLIRGLHLSRRKVPGQARDAGLLT